MCSPRTWGWSVAATLLRGDETVLPTHVGMVRGGQTPRLPRPVLPTHVGMVLCEERLLLYAQRAPHARGDGPQVRQQPGYEHNVLPTHVGMVRHAPG